MDITTIFREFDLLPQQEELELIAKYKQGDSEAGNTVMTTRMSWIYYVVKSLSLPSWVNEDDVAGDVAADISISLLNYEPDRASVSTFMYNLIRHRSWGYASDQQQEFEVAIDGNSIPEPEISDPSEVINTIRGLFEDIELNEHSRIVFDRMLKGLTPYEICRQLGWTREHVSRRMTALRQRIAWMMIKSGNSASPWIQDKDLAKLASEYEASQHSLLPFDD